MSALIILVTPSNFHKESSSRTNHDSHTVLKWWRHKKWNSWNYGICQDILKEQCPRGLLAKNEHLGQIVAEIVAQLCFENSRQILLNFFWVEPPLFLDLTCYRFECQRFTQNTFQRLYTPSSFHKKSVPKQMRIPVVRLDNFRLD